MKYRLQIFDPDGRLFINTKHESDDLGAMKRLASDDKFHGYTVHVVEQDSRQVIYEPPVPGSDGRPLLSSIVCNELPSSMKSVYDHMTAEQRVRFDAHVMRQRAKPATTIASWAYCGKFIADFQPADPPRFEELQAGGAVPVPNFGWFCSRACANSYELDFGIRFRRDASGKVCYD